ncbi:hypothetical protein ACFPYJ_14775 [Paenibacillus solisilvae]|uniref:Uncharacterized protein n=1 Tax=Paenibacillus solisilvae TaxID=2486751 RepID=A0ABW0W1T2_9BACL
MIQAYKKRWAKVLLTASCMLVMIAGTAMAAPGDAQSSSVKISNTAAAEDKLANKQAEIDAFISGAGHDELAEQGFTVTHTVVVGGSVEVGITPYDEKHANFLYQKFGRESVKVVEGAQAVTFEAAGAADAAAPSDAGNGQESSGNLWITLAAAAAIIAGILVAKRRKLFSRS